MNTVGADKRLQYYRLSADQVIADLKSHQMGLTNVEAERRYQEHGANALSRTIVEPLYIRGLRQFREPHLVAPLVGALLATFSGAVLLDWAFAAIALLQLIVGLATTGNRRAMLDLSRFIPKRTTVVRNGHASHIAAYQLVLGDIVQLEAGDTVPADLRLLDEHGFTTDDSMLFGGSNHIRKFVHTLDSIQPLSARNNLAYAGTAVVGGSAHGIVVATGTQTELGRITALQQALQPPKSYIQARLHNVEQYTLLAGVIVAAIVALIGWQASTDFTQTILLASAAMASVISGGPMVARYLLWRRARVAFGAQNIRSSSVSSLQDLAHADMLLVTQAACRPGTTVTRLIVGRTAYTAKDTGYQPTGRVLDELGKPIAKEDSANLALVLEAATLTTTAAVLPPDAQHQQWHIHGDHTDGAILTFVRKTGLHTERLRMQYEELHAFPFDAHRQLACSVRQYGDDVIVFVRGTPEAVIAHSKKLWDHGHVRSLTAKDVDFYAKHAAAVTAEGATGTAFAYRILPKNTDIPRLDATTCERNLTFLGVVDTQASAHPNTYLNQLAATYPHLRYTLITDAPYGQAMTGDELRRLSDAQLANKFTASHTTFTHLLPEDVARLVVAAQHAGRIVAVAGASFSDMPALQRADVAIACHAAQPIAGMADLAIDDANQLGDIFSASQLFSARVHEVLVAATTHATAALSVVLLSAFGVLYFAIPPAQTAIQILVALLVIQPIVLVLFGNNYRAAHTPKFNTVAADGIALGFIIYGVYLAFFAVQSISPVYIDPTSRLAATAATVALITFALCQWINALFAQSDSQRKRTVNIPPADQALWALCAVIFIVLCVSYSAPFNTLLGTSPLSFTDWLLVLSGMAMYASICLFQRYTHRHSRQAIVRLHNQTHGKASETSVQR